MKIAIATEHGVVSAHFVRCPSYTLVEIEGNHVLAREEIPNPGHRPGFLPAYLAEKGVSTIIAGGMGPRAQDLFAQNNISSVIGVQGTVDETISRFLTNELKPGEDMCDHQTGDSHAGEGAAESPPVHIATDAKICFTAQGKDWDAEMDPRFGRAAYFLLLDPVAQQIEAVTNPYLDDPQGVGIRAAQLLVDKGVKILFTGQVGPKADQVLRAAGVQIVSGTTGTVRNVVQSFVQEMK